MTFTLAIIGRPNVGKSTLYNRLTGTQHALVDDQPGVTRDWKSGEGSIADLSFTVLDTAGLDDNGKGSLERRMFEQTTRALARADAALFMVDARAGVTPEDERFAGWLRQSGKPIILALNKAEGKHGIATLAEAYALGLGEPVIVSAAHGEGMQELYVALLPFEKEAEAPQDFAEDDENAPVHIAIIGRPNAGKSTLLNCLLKEERALTGPEAGITRDAIAEKFDYKGREIKIVDTAGIRKKANVVAGIERMAVADALRVIRYANVVIVLLDAEQALEKQDLALISLVEREGRAVIIGINKWDLIEDKDAYMKITFARIAKVIPQVKDLPVIPLSALHGKHVEKLLDAALAAYRVWNIRLTTGELNRWLEAVLQRHSPPIVNNKRIKIRYMTQIKTRPPTFMLFTNNSADFPESYSRYLVNSLREDFKMPGVPIRIQLKKGKNPYENA